MTHDILISLPQFEGPLYQLHYLLKKDELDILDLPIAKITSLALSQTDESFFAKGTEVMYYAAIFLTWKTRKLLPKEEKLELIEEEGDGLITQLLGQAEFKEIVSGLFELEQKRLPHFSRDITLTFEKDHQDLETVELDELALLFQKIMEKSIPIEMEIEEELDLSSKMNFLIAQIQVQKEIDFEELFSLQKSKVELIVTFLALLELIKGQQLTIVRNEEQIIIKTFELR